MHEPSSEEAKSKRLWWALLFAVPAIVFWFSLAGQEALDRVDSPRATSTKTAAIDRTATVAKPHQFDCLLAAGCRSSAAYAVAPGSRGNALLGKRPVVRPVGECLRAQFVWLAFQTNCDVSQHQSYRHEIGHSPRGMGAVLSQCGSPNRNARLTGTVYDLAGTQRRCADLCPPDCFDLERGGRDHDRAQHGVSDRFG